MRASRSFTVRPRLPEALAPLAELALNLRWAWDRPTRELFDELEPGRDEMASDPLQVLNRVDRSRLEELAADAGFLARLAAAEQAMRAAMADRRWFQRRDSELRCVAYFSPEFGIAEALPQYSGGLGVLAGDHLKAASNLGLPLIGVGLLYRQGYFHQELSDDGWQQERYVDLDPYAMALQPIEDARVEVDMGGTTVAAQVWRAQVERVVLYLLDADVEENGVDERRITDRLYGGGTEHRLRQEILLGVGGVRALERVGKTPQVFHTNEGHAGFLGLERIRRAVVDHGLSFAEAVELVRAGTVFTTHTPVPAGIDLFPRPLITRYFGAWAEQCGIGLDELMALGHEPDESAEAPFNMAVMGLRLAARSNAVSELHGIVSRRMFSGLWPGVAADEVPITSITNGVHARTWVAPAMAELFEGLVGPEWDEADAGAWAAIDKATDEELWKIRDEGRRRLVQFARGRLRDAALARGASEGEASWYDDVLDPDVLTIGFARRFAAYKRATLLLSQPDRLHALLSSETRPIQLVFAGKAHPADEQGKQMIRQIAQFSRQGHVRHRIAFLEDYDIAVARLLFQGCDVWLNTPRRPFEACGTSGEKAALNGSLNCSIRDGWWDEMFDGENGWAIASAESYGDLDWRDQVEAANLFDVLERRVVPLFYAREDGGIPRPWLARVRASLRSLGPRVSAARMTRSYVTELYEPSAVHADRMAASGQARARELAAWKRRARAAWPEVAISVVDDGSDGLGEDLGASRPVHAIVTLGSLTPEDVKVELLHGRVGATDELHDTSVTALELVGLAEEPGRYRYEGSFACENAGRYGFAARVVPAHPDLVTFAEIGRVTWA